MPDRIRFAELEFDPASGEIFSLAEGSGREVTRLSPQPARLLEYLIANRPELVGLEEIRQVLWPDVQIEFEQSLHFCIRQIRSALNDSASDPRFIETVPRRGYRFIALVQEEAPAGGPGASTDGGSGLGNAGVSRDRTRYLGGLVIFLVLAAVALAWILGAFRTGDQTTANPSRGAQSASPLRLGIMSFEARDPATGRFRDNNVAELLLLALEEPGVLEADIIGPTTTSAYESESEGLSKLIDDFRLDYVLNGRFLERDGRQFVLAELIRATDGAHIWVEAFEDFPENPQIPEKIRLGALEKLRAESIR